MKSVHNKIYKTEIFARIKSPKIRNHRALHIYAILYNSDKVIVVNKNPIRSGRSLTSSLPVKIGQVFYNHWLPSLPFLHFDLLVTFACKMNQW